MDLGSFAEYFRLPARVYAAVSIVAAFLLFGPSKFLTEIGLGEFATDYRRWIAFSLLIAAALLISEIVHNVWKYFRSQVDKRKGLVETDRRAAIERAQEEETSRELQRRRIERLKNLTEDEKAMLAPFITRNMRSGRVPMNSATLAALKGSDILGMSNQISNYDMRLGDYAAQVFIQPWAMEHLKEHPELLE